MIGEVYVKPVQEIEAEQFRPRVCREVGRGGKNSPHLEDSMLGTKYTFHSTWPCSLPLESPSERRQHSWMLISIKVLASVQGPLVEHSDGAGYPTYKPLCSRWPTRSTYTGTWDAFLFTYNLPPFTLKFNFYSYPRDICIKSKKLKRTPTDVLSSMLMLSLIFFSHLYLMC